MSTQTESSSLNRQPKKMVRASTWSDEVEEAYRFQTAGFRDEIEYMAFTKSKSVDRWPENNYVKKLLRKDGCFYYYDRTRECSDKDLYKIKLYSY
ncbi:meiosis expressed gene 1 protein homolog [Tubulanus polymorphus]|uniref:meiosis expressed gene 1 protein homolog n=1 Tax=Tubulanus polymorphus TaxID=672921 RepID=UPI003DA419A7